MSSPHAISSIANAVHDAMQAVMRKHGKGIVGEYAHTEAPKFPITLTERAPTDPKESEKVWRGGCLCGAVGLEIDRTTIADKGTQFCHCNSCRVWHAAPIVAEMLFSSTNGTTKIFLVQGADHLKYVETSQGQRRACCARCGARLLNLKGTSMVLATFPQVFPDMMPTVQIERHTFWDEKVMDLQDGLPKFLDLPESLGGSGKVAGAQ